MIRSSTLAPAPPRKRAPALTPDQRREEIISATLPLLRQHGADVTTSQIAQAAGIAEGTIFRAFEDKRELLLAALRKAMAADAEVERIGRISGARPLEERLVAALAAVSDYQDRLWSLMRVLQESGWQPDHGKSEREHHPRHQVERIGVAMARLFEPEKAELRLDPCTAAHMLLGLAFSSRMREQGMGAAVKPRQLIDLFLHGAMKARGGEA